MSGVTPIPESTLYTINLYPERVDFERLALVFCCMSRETYRRSSFLDHRIERAPGEGLMLPFNAVDEPLVLPATPVTHAVFHSAFCCSTLLSRYIDALDHNLVLREPHALYELLILRLMQGTGLLPDVPGERIASLLSLVRYLLGRRADPRQPVVIKHTDGCNIAMSELLAYPQGSRGLFMWSTLERFLAAIFKLPQRREWIYTRLQELMVAWQRREGRLPVDPRSVLPHQAAALLWILQMENLEQALVTLPAGSLVTLDAQMFLADPVSVLQRVMCHFSAPIEQEQIERMLAGSDLGRHSKSAAESYDSVRREDDFHIARAKFAAEIDAAIAWAGNVLGRDWREYRPPAPLVSAD